MSNVWENQYRAKGFAAQREYPNESLIIFCKRFCRPGDKVLEIGCGSGANLWFLAKQGFKTFGMDYSATGLAYCRKMLKKWQARARLKLGNMLKLPYSDNYFQVIVDVVSSQHLTYTEHQQAYREIYRCLTPGGYFFSFHLADGSVSFRQGGGRLIDKKTVDNIKDSSKPLANNGVTCFLAAFDAARLLKQAKFINLEIDKLTRTYNNQDCKIEYLVIKAQKPCP